MSKKLPANSLKESAKLATLLIVSSRNGIPPTGFRESEIPCNVAPNCWSRTTALCADMFLKLSRLDVTSVNEKAGSVASKRSVSVKPIEAPEGFLPGFDARLVVAEGNRK